MSKSSRRATPQCPASPMRTIAEVIVVFVALAVLCIPGRTHAETGDPAGGCEPQVRLSAEVTAAEQSSTIVPTVF